MRTFPDQRVPVPYQIIDLDKINLPSIYKNISYFRIAFTCDIPDSDTNLLKFYNLTLNFPENGTSDYSVPKAIGGYDL